MDLESLRKSFIGKQDEAGMGTLPGLANMLKGAGAPPADAGTAKIPLTLLPAGAQPGQRISLTVTGIDAVSGMATVVPDAVQNAVPEAPIGQKQDAVDKAITMGPMDDLRTYLFQKTQEQEQ
jgi:hypothetical protein